MAANLEDVPSLDLMHELLRRMKCSSKPDKRLILIGMKDNSPAPTSNLPILAGACRICVHAVPDPAPRAATLAAVHRTTSLLSLCPRRRRKSGKREEGGGNPFLFGPLGLGVLAVGGIFGPCASPEGTPA
nr:unnamed protein product [Digitaria exilis]